MTNQSNITQMTGKCIEGLTINPEGGRQNLGQLHGAKSHLGYKTDLEPSNVINFTE